MNAAIITAAIIVFLSVACPVTVTWLLVKRFIRRYDMDKRSFALRTEDIEDEYSVRHTEFKSGRNDLHAYIIGEENKKELVVFCHGLFGGAEEYLQFAMHFADKGYTVFMFDNTGCNRSGGRNIQGTLQGLYDLHAAIDFIESEPSLKGRKIILAGHSWGGFTAAAFPHNGTDIAAVISIAGFDKPVPAITDFISGMFGKAFNMLYPYNYLVQFFKYGKACETSAVCNLNKSKIPCLVIQGTNDKIIHFNGSSIYNNRHRLTDSNVKFLVYSDAKHNKHNTVYRDSDATAYMEGRYALMRDARRTLRGDELEKRLDEIFAHTDRKRINKLDSRFTHDVDAFLDEALKKQ